MILLLLDFTLIIVFGKTYTKYKVYGFLHLHDLVITILCILSIIFNKKNKPSKSIAVVLLIIPLIYLIFSISRIDDCDLVKIYYVLRQFMIIGYAIIMYFITTYIFSLNNGRKLALVLIISIAIIAFLWQIYHVTILRLINLENPFGRFPVSPIIMLGVIIFGSYSLLFLKKFRYLFFLVSMIISLTTGQDSSYLAMLVVLVSFLLIKNKVKKKYVLTSTAILIILLCVSIPTLSDVNVIWRLVYWKDTLVNLINNKTIFFGNGFGIPYLEENTRLAVNEVMLSRGYGVTVEGLEIFEIAPHNSFLTLIYHLGIFGLFPIIILIFKLINADKRYYRTKYIIFLLIALTGLSFWSFFNLILELPHSSSGYWFLYFTLILSLKKSKNNVMQYKFRRKII